MDADLQQKLKELFAEAQTLVGELDDPEKLARIERILVLLEDTMQEQGERLRRLPNYGG